ncbi:MAG: DJ-1/PfpI family protein [Alphaproteobacteria bacterium]|nr:DJ-1/PfpI family protein [Alphaproteobacteria bacterium]
MNKPLVVQRKVAVLVANGFIERDLTRIQQYMLPLGADLRIVSMDHGLVNSWDGTGWGLNFAADKTLNTALAADFSMLVIPGGRRSVEKLKLTAHTRRFIGGFLESGKPVVALNDSLDLLVHAEKLSGMRVAGPQELREMAIAAGADWSDEETAVCDNLMTGILDDTTAEPFLSVLSAFLIEMEDHQEAVAA